MSALQHLAQPIVAQVDPEAGALAAANRWVDAARPIIRAMFALEDIDLSAVDGDYTRQEATGYVMEAFSKLYGMLDNIRDEHIADERRAWNPLMSDREAEQVDAFNDWLDDNVTSVAGAIKAEVNSATWGAH